MAAFDRREFIKSLVVLGGAPCLANEAAKPTGGALGVLVDIPNCIGCRKCEFACQKQAGFAVPPIESFEDTSVFQQYRRPRPGSYTTVNRYPNPADATKPIAVKVNCFHCLEPACASACIVGALKKQPSGAVTYDAWKCMGCRYCMVACPFGIPTYEYDNALTPQVRKCTFCFERTEEGGVPACVQICPNDALIFGERENLLKEARRRIEARPDLYLPHIYGEHEAGGTSWLYLSSVPFDQVGFLSLGSQAPTHRTEPLQHGIFKFFVPPAALYGLLGLVHWVTKRSPVPLGTHHAAESLTQQTDLSPGNGEVKRVTKATPPRTVCEESLT